MSDRTIAYLSHPIGPFGGANEDQARQDNIADAHAWLRLLVERTNWTIECSWLSYVAAITDDEYRPRTMIDQFETMSRCDLIVLTGGHVSPHMRVEASQARRLAIRVLDLTWIHRARSITDEESHTLDAVLAAVND